MIVFRWNYCTLEYTVSEHYCRGLIKNRQPENVKTDSKKTFVLSGVRIL